MDRLQDKTWREREKSASAALIGRSPQIEKVRQLIKRISQFSNAPVLITGETGAGKEVIANLLHASSPRADKPLIKVNCSTLAEPLFESQLFGHRKGAFTGAHDTQKGLVEAAKDGTLFLDEISTLKLELQPKLLRLLEDGGYVPVGETVERRTNVWIIVASNENLADLVRQKLFRADLYYRLKDIEISMPPLRDRSMDILPLAAHFLAQFSQEFGRQFPTLSPEAQNALLQCHWPGNVRELKNVMRKAIIYGQGNIIGLEHFAMETAEEAASHASVMAMKTLREVERDYILAVFKNSGCKIRATAQLLGIDRNTLRKKLFEYSVRFSDIRDG